MNSLLCLLVECKVTQWTEWSACCNSERKSTRTIVRGDQCKEVREVEDCTDDNCPGPKTQIYFFVKFYSQSTAK